MYKLILTIAAVFAFLTSNAQNKFIGLWEGKMNVGVEIVMVFKINLNDSNKFVATFDVPDQGLNAVPVDVVEVIGDSLKLEIRKFKASYSGKMDNDSLINGMFKQQASFPLQLKRVQKISVKIRPQTPVPPFPYESKDITYRNRDRSITYGATITIPNGKGPFPAVMLLTGSGQQNRDEEISGHKPFAVIADHLTKNGFVVLRADDRGMGQTTGNVDSATTADFAGDASEGINYLISRKEVDKSKIGFIGHSEGAMIAQIVSAKRSDISFIISLAGPGTKIPLLMSEQNRAILGKAGLSKDYIDKYLPFYDSMLQTIINEDKNTFDSAFLKVVNRWMDTTQPNIVLITTGIKDSISKKEFIKSVSPLATSNWFRYFLKYDPAENVRKFRGHFLALNGDQDVQVLSKSNLKGLETALKNGSAKSYQVKELKGLNHLFQECRKCNTYEYGELDQTISPVVLEEMTSWLQKIVSIK